MGWFLAGFDDDPETYGTWLRQDPLLRFFIERYAESYRRELDAFIRAIEAGVAPPIGVSDGRAALAVADAAVESAKSGRPVALQAV
jgi:myo-inositol 2-dehydrogenase/D-chiro-inositol 1-dehydrogenase